MFDLPDSEPLLTLLALHEAGSESSAAEILGIGQSSVSRRIATLQRLTGQPLTVRTATGTKLTEFGERLLPYAREARAALAGAGRWLATDGAAAWAISVGLDADLAPRYAGPLASLQGDGRSVTLAEGWSRDLVERVRGRELDAAVVLWAPAGAEPGITSQRLGEDDLVMVAAAGTRLVTDGALDPVALSSRPLLVPPTGSEVAGRARAELRSAGLAPSCFVEVGSPAAVREAVLSGAGVGVGAAGSFGPELAAGWMTSARLGRAAALSSHLVVSDGLPPAAADALRHALGLPTTKVEPAAGESA